MAGAGRARPPLRGRVVTIFGHHASHIDHVTCAHGPASGWLGGALRPPDHREDDCARTAHRTRSCACAAIMRPQPRRWPRRTDGGAHRAYATETLRVAAGGVARPRPLPGRPRPDGSWQVSSGDAARGVPISIEETHAIGRSGPGTRYLPFAIHGPYKQFYTGRVSHFRGCNFA